MNLFALKVLISFFVGGTFISLQTLIAERVPHSWRGIILTIPSTLAISILFIGLTKGAAEIPHVAVSAVASSLICIYVFAAAFSYFSKRGLAMAAATGFACWGASACLLIMFPPKTVVESIVIGIPILFVSYAIVSRLPQTPKIVPVPFTLPRIAMRALFAGTAVVLAVVSAKLFGNVWGGIFSSFPAVFSTTLIVYYVVHRPQVVPAVAKSLFFPGSIILVLYSLAAAASFPYFGVWIGTLISYAVCLTVVIPFKVFPLRRRAE